jgi:hypothetical protein
MLVTGHRGWIDNWIYRTLTTRNCKYIERYYSSTHLTNRYRTRSRYVMSSTDVAGLQFLLGVAMLRLLTTELLLVPCSSPCRMVTGLQLKFPLQLMAL